MIFEPRGIRANNPGNLRYNRANAWQGRATFAEMTPAQRMEHEFEVFKAPEWGIRALAVTLITYYDRYQLDTIAKLIGRWAPPNENNTASYILSVAKSAGINPTLPLDIHDYDVLRSLVIGIIAHENGVQPYDSQTIDKGLALAGVTQGMKPLGQSRTMIGSAVTAIGTAGGVAAQIDDVKMALAPLQWSLPWIQYGLVALTLAGIALTIYARWSDQNRRVV